MTLEDFVTNKSTHLQAFQEEVQEVAFVSLYPSQFSLQLPLWFLFGQPAAAFNEHVRLMVYKWNMSTPGHTVMYMRCDLQSLNKLTHIISSTRKMYLCESLSLSLCVCVHLCVDETNTTWLVLLWVELWGFKNGSTRFTCCKCNACVKVLDSDICDHFKCHKKNSDIKFKVVLSFEGHISTLYSERSGEYEWWPSVMLSSLEDSFKEKKYIYVKVYIYQIMY